MVPQEFSKSERQRESANARARIGLWSPAQPALTPPPPRPSQLQVEVTRPGAHLQSPLQATEDITLSEPAAQSWSPASLDRSRRKPCG